MLAPRSTKLFAHLNWKCGTCTKNLQLKTSSESSSLQCCSAGCHPSEPPYNFFWNQICLFGRELGRITGYLTDVFTKSVKSPSLINSRSDSRPHCSDWMGRDSSRLWSRSRTPAGPPLNHRDVACTLEKRIVYSTSDMSTRGDGWRRVLAVAAA